MNETAMSNVTVRAALATDPNAPGSGAPIHADHIDRLMIARNGILDDLYRRFHVNDKGVKCLDPKDSHRWYNPMQQKNCFTGSGSMVCPVCKTGELRYSRSSYNGHVHGRCSTDGCVAWME